MAVLARGTVIAGYRIESFVGRGGMGVVYRARQIALDRIVALKVIAPELLEDADIRERFVQEARAAAGIDHPNVIPVHAAGEDGGVAYIAMRFVDGDDVRALVRREGALAVDVAAGFVGQAAAALDAIHGAGFVHRDVKPANLLVAAGGHVYLTDFGLAKQVITRSGPTRSGGWVGTLDYISPEQVRGGRIDARADVYALGGVLHFVLTGHVPFEREGQEAKLWAQLHDAPPVPSALVPGLAPELDAVVARAMAKDPEERYPSAGDLGRAVRAAAAGTAPSQPERMVARGAAAPGDAPLEPGLETPTISAAHPTVVLTRHRAWRPIAAALATAAAGAGIAAYVLADDSPTGAALVASAPTSTPTPTAMATATPRATPASPVRVVDTIRHVGKRPGGIALAGGDVWVISDGDPVVTRLSAKTGRERTQHTQIGTGASDIAADGDAVWIALGPARAIVRLDARTGSITRRIATPGPANHLAAGGGGVWVATGDDRLVHYDASTGDPISSKGFADGVGPVAFGGGRVWVAQRATAKLARLDPRTGRIINWTPLSEPASALRFGGGYLWVAQRGEDSVARITPLTNDVRVRSAGHGPAEIAVSRGKVFIASNTDDTLLVLDRRTLRQLGRRVAMAANPYAVAADSRGVWVTGLAGSTVTRLAYR